MSCGTWLHDEQFMRLRVVLARDVRDAGEKLSKRELKRRAKGKVKKVKDSSKWKSEGSKKKPKKTNHLGEHAFVNTTPKGEKKDLSGQMLAAYQPKAVEAAWQAWWEASGFCTAHPRDVEGRNPAEKFVMVIPPPNVTGSLHLGHALTTAIQDCLTRWHRMCGHVTLYVPGTDHAGIATQSVVEKRLMKEEGLVRHDLGREEFLRRVWAWKDQYSSRIETQLRSLGSSVDWSRLAFTMDENLCTAVTEAFVRFHEAGILYRGTRLVNWSCALRSAISKIEVDVEEIKGRSFRSVPGHKKRESYEFGTLTSFAYKVADDDGNATDEEIIVATTRVETMLGDAAVAVHPEDPRYTHLHGKFVKHPFTDQLLPIVVDDVLVDMKFGTGAVKITPAHDPNDYECGKRHNLPFNVIFNLDGTTNEACRRFAGMMRYDARIAVEDSLKQLGLYRDKEDNPMALSICSRSGDVIEPMLTPQWFVDCREMAERAKDAVRTRNLKIKPEFHEQTWFTWLNNVDDWCVSRQLWWGHRIPAYFATKKEEQLDCMDEQNSSRWVVARSVEEALEKAESMLNVSRERIRLEQDPDVLDTWFSSGLFPFSVFGWPRETPDLQAFYPTSLLETGLDILFFWVARMVMMGLQLTDQLPFHTVYLHAMVRDKYGRKMSKSLGNVIDPLEVINGCDLEVLKQKLESGNLPKNEIEKALKGQEEEFPDGIPECGCDALRFGLLAYTVQGRNINLDIKRVLGYRNFCNKLWNVTRFALTYIKDVQPTLSMQQDVAKAILARNPALSPRDYFIFSQLNTLAHNVNELLAAYEFGETANTIHSFWRDDLCDFYIEVIKPTMKGEDTPQKLMTQKILYVCLDCALRLTHPLMPFVTEELWQRLPGRGSIGSSEPPSIMLAPFPLAEERVISQDVVAETRYVQDVINAGRSLREQYQLGRTEVEMYLVVKDAQSPTEAGRLRVYADDIATLCRCRKFEVHTEETSVPANCATRVVSPTIKLLMNLSGLVDPAAELKKLRKELGKLNAALSPLLKKMEAPGYSDCVPQKVQDENRSKAKVYKAKRENIIAEIARWS